MKLLGLFLIIVGVFFAAIAVLQPASIPLQFPSLYQKAILGFFVGAAEALTGAGLLWSKRRHRQMPSYQVAPK